MKILKVIMSIIAALAIWAAVILFVPGVIPVMGMIAGAAGAVLLIIGPILAIGIGLYMLLSKLF